MRTSLRAFVIGERGLIEDTGKLEKYGDRAEIKTLTGDSYGRNIFRAIRVISLMQGLIECQRSAEDEELHKMLKRGSLLRTFMEDGRNVG